MLKLNNRKILFRILGIFVSVSFFVALYLQYSSHQELKNKYNKLDHEYRELNVKQKKSIQLFKNEEEKVKSLDESLDKKNKKIEDNKKKNKKQQQELKQKDIEINELKSNIKRLEAKKKEAEKVKKLQAKADKTKAKEDKSNQQTVKATHTARSVRSEDSSDWMTFKATYYDANFQSTGKSPGSKGYGITASGRPVQAGTTIAVDPNVIPLGKQVQIKFPDGHIENRRADDTGSAISGRKIDIYVPKATLSSGKHDVKVKVIN